MPRKNLNTSLYTIENYKSGPWICIKKNNELTEDCIKDIEKIKKLFLTENYTYSLINLPESLTDLYIGNDNRNNVVYFNTKEIINQPLDFLPFKLERLTIESYSFNQPLDFLPVNLESLVIKSNSFNQEFNNLPPNLKILHIESYNFDKYLENLPLTLEKLYIKGTYKYLDILKEKNPHLNILTIH